MKHDFYLSEMECAAIDAGNCFFPGTPGENRGFVAYRDTVGDEWFVIDQTKKVLRCAKGVILLHCDDAMEYSTYKPWCLAYDDEEHVLLFDRQDKTRYGLTMPVIFESK